MHTLYAKVEDGVVIETMPKPRWFFDDGVQVDDAYLATESIFPVNTSEDASKENMYFSKEVNQASDMVFDAQSNTVKNYYKYTTIPLEDVLEKVYTEKRSGVDAERDRNIFSNFIYQFSDGPGEVQLRNETDQRNIQVNGMAALADIVAGTPQITHVFMDANNTPHNMTAQEMLGMSTFAKNRGQHFYSVSWAHKHQGLAGIYTDNTKTNQQKIDDIVAYNIEAGWELPN